ncbi:MAG: phospholipase D-like domain-containing protein [Spirochaetales bacterium]|jgi:HKD family nuclease|nr:phospholipase D-like domain-containing protein [Spirochaetales bacterium]
MSVTLLKSPFENKFRDVLCKTRQEIIFSSPYINHEGVSILLDSIGNIADKSIQILTNLSARNIIDNVTQPIALLKIYNTFKKTIISSLNKLHAKIYIIDESYAIITSANLTNGGIRTNFEYGVLIDDSQLIKTIKQDVLDYVSLGHIFDKPFLARIHKESQKIERVQDKTFKERNDFELKLLLEQGQKINDIFIKRYKNKETRHSIFVKTVRFLLENHSQLTTLDLYELVKDIHPEMCDDTIEYHNEKRWKIEVRQALFFWRRKGIVAGSGMPHHQIWELSED